MPARRSAFRAPAPQRCRERSCVSPWRNPRWRARASGERAPSGGFVAPCPIRSMTSIGRATGESALRSRTLMWETPGCAGTDVRSDGGGQTYTVTLSMTDLSSSRSRDRLGAAGASHPVEGKDANPVRSGRLDTRREVGAVVGRDLAEHPRGRGPDDLARRVETLDCELHVGSRETTVLAVDVAAEHRPRLAGRDIELDPEPLFQGFLGKDVRGAGGGRQNDSYQPERRPDSAHRSTPV